MRRFAAWFVLLVVLLATLPALALGEDLGDMEVVNCSEWVSLRETPSTRADRLVKVSLGAVVSNCRQVSEKWIYAEYDGYAGYILAEYLTPCEGRLTFNAMMITITGDGAPFYATLDSTEPRGFIPPNTIVRNCCIMDNNRIYVEWGSRCGFISLMHAEVYGEMIHYPDQMQLTCNLFDGTQFDADLELQITYAHNFPLWDHAYHEYDYRWGHSQGNGTDESGYPEVSFVLHADRQVTDVHLFNLSIDDWSIETGEAVFTAELAYIQPGITSEQPLLVTSVIYGSMPNLAVGFKDASGAYHFAFIEISGEDGSLLLREF